MYAESLRHYLKPVIEYLDDPAVTEIMINGPEDIWIEKKGRVYKVEQTFTTEGIEAAARNMAQYVGRMLDDERPRLDARLPDGSRIHVVMPPIARKGCTIAIRKFFPDKLTVEMLVEFGSMTPAMARFINACVNIKENIIVSGGTGSGKTTLLNCVAQYIPDDERILTIEDSAELQLNQEHLVPFESRPPDKFGKGKVDMGDLLQSALRLRPDRIVVGEVRGGEAFDLMQAMNTGHGGSLATVHANTPTDTLRRLESLCLQSGVELPMVAVRAQVASAINVVICCDRLQDGQRKTTHISEVLPLDEKGDYRTQDIFVYTPTHKDEDGKVHGYHAPTGLIPTFISRLAAYGFADVDEAFFDPATYDVEPPPVFTASEGYKAKWAPSLAHREHGEPDSKNRPKPKTGGHGSGSASGSQSQGGGSGTGSAPSAGRAEASAAPSEEKAVEASADPQPTAPPSSTPEPEPPVEPELSSLDEAPDFDEDESTDPGLVNPVAVAEPGTGKPSVPEEEDALEAALAEDPAVAEAGSLASPDEKTSVGAKALADASSEPDPESDPEDEMAAIEAALAAEAAAAPEVKEKSEPSIQLSDDFAEEAAKVAPDDEEPGPRRPRIGQTGGAMAGRPRPAAGRRRKGGVVGRPGDPD